MFKPVFINATDLNDAYFSLLWKIWENGRNYIIDSGSFAGSYRLEFDYVSGFIRDPHRRPLAPIMPPSIAPTTTDDRIMEYFVNYLMDADLNEGEHYRYSSWLNSTEYYGEFGADGRTTKQINETPIEWVIRHFNEKGHGNNHCFINIGNVDSGFNYDIPYSNENERRTSPCFRGIDFKIKGGQLITSVIFRSWDLYAGFPENMGGITLLNEFVCAQLSGVVPGPLAFTSAGLHIYSYQINPVMAILNKEK
jgi:thymidylate synthase